MDNRDSAVFSEKYCFLKYYDRITYIIDECDSDTEAAELQAVLTEAMLNESVTTQAFVALCVHAYEH